MKKTLLRNLGILFCLTFGCFATVHAQIGTFSVNDINYRIISTADATCEVDYTPGAGTNSKVVIPSTVVNGDKEYSVIGVAENAFNYALGMESIQFSDGITYIGAHAFEDCWDLLEVYLPETVTSVGGYAFYNCINLTTITFPESVTEMGTGAMYGCESLESAFLSPNVPVVPMFTFANCAEMQEIEIPEGVTTISMQSFISCTYLTDVFLPSTLTNIMMEGFKYVFNIKTLTCNAVVPPTLSQSAFEQTVYDNTRLIVPEESLDAYRSHPVWSLFKSLDENSVESLTADNLFTLNGDILHNLSSSEAAVFNIDGSTAALIPANSSIILNPGLYIVKKQNISKKIVVK